MRKWTWAWLGMLVPGGALAAFPDYTPELLAERVDTVVAGHVVRAEAVKSETGLPLASLWFESPRCLLTGRAPVSCRGTEVEVRVSPLLVPDWKALSGSRVLVYTRGHADSLYMWGGPRALYAERRGLAFSASGDPVVDVDCGTPPLVARPVAEEPRPEARAAEPLGSPTAVFAEEPASLAMSWEDLSGVLVSCALAEKEAR